MLTSELSSCKRSLTVTYVTTLLATTLSACTTVETQSFPGQHEFNCGVVTGRDRC